MSINDDDLQSILNDIKIGDIVNVVLNNSSVIAGRFMPRYESSERDHIVIKLPNGYNVGILLKKIKFITKVSSFSSKTDELPKKNLYNSGSLKPQDKNDNDLSQISNLPKIALLVQVEQLLVK